MLTRLHSKYPELAQMILASSSAQLQPIAATAAKLALRKSGLEGNLLRMTLAAVEGKEELPPDVKKRLAESQKHLDDSYLDAQDLPDDQDEPPAEALQLFYRARALAAVLAALAEVDAVGATEVVYEAIAAHPDETETVEAILKVAGR